MDVITKVSWNPNREVLLYSLLTVEVKADFNLDATVRKDVDVGEYASVDLSSLVNEELNGSTELVLETTSSFLS